MSTKKDIINPKTEYGILKYCLQIVALIQNRNSQSSQMNAGFIKKLLFPESHDKNNKSKTPTNKAITGNVKKVLSDMLGLQIDMSQGARSWGLTADIDKETLLHLLRLYTTFFIDDSAKDIVLNILIEKIPGKCLWVLAQLYFASKKKERVKITYKKSDIGDSKEYIINPYHLVIRNNELYLISFCMKDKIIKTFIVHRIQDIENLKEFFDDEIPTVEEFYKYSFGAGFTEERYNLKLQVHASSLPQVTNVFSNLHPQVKDTGPDEAERNYEVSFTVCDIQSACKQLFFYGGGVKIIEPVEAVDLMKKMLEEGMGIYK